MASTNMTLGGGVAQSDQAAPGSSSSSNSLPASNSSLKELALNSTQVICVSYTDPLSVGNNSFIDLQISCRHNVVSSNQTELDQAEQGSLAIVRCSSKKDGCYAVIGLLGPHVPDCKVWADRGGGFFKYAREFTPVTDVFPIDSIKDKWNATCQVHEVTKNPKNMFNMRFCKLGRWFIPALHDALRLGVFPSRSSAMGTRTTFV